MANSNNNDSDDDDALNISKLMLPHINSKDKINSVRQFDCDIMPLIKASNSDDQESSKYKIKKRGIYNGTIPVFNDDFKLLRAKFQENPKFDAISSKFSDIN